MMLSSSCPLDCRSYIVPRAHCARSLVLRLEYFYHRRCPIRSSQPEALEARGLLGDPRHDLALHPLRQHHAHDVLAAMSMIILPPVSGILLHVTSQAWG